MSATEPPLQPHAQTSPALISIEEYLRTSYHPDREYIDGVVEERNIGELNHGILQTELGFWFRSHRDEWQIQVGGGLRIRVTQTRVRIPDVCLVPLDAPREPVRVTPALLCIEILSPQDRLVRIAKRMDDFLAMGVKHLWLIDPLARLAYTYTRAGLSDPIAARLTIPHTPIYLDLPTLFTALD
jgi:Uma2 family endonuclease